MPPEAGPPQSAGSEATARDRRLGVISERLVDLGGRSGSAHLARAEAWPPDFPSGTLCRMPERDEPSEWEPGGSLLPDLILNRISPNEALAHLVEVLHATDEPDPDLCLEVGCGDLESVLANHETELWDEIERLARTDPRFRRALSSVWAYDSAQFNRREALLAELGEHREITVRFTVTPDDFAPDPALSWRAFEAEGGITNRRLAEMLRRLAEWLDRQPPDSDAGSP